MATFETREAVDEFIAGNGRIDPEDALDNPWATRIVEYTNQGGRRVWGVVFEGDFDPFRYERESPFMSDQRVIWTREAE